MSRPVRSSTYEIRVVLRAPLPFVFRWCTDYSPRDPVLEKDTYQRKIIARSARRVVYEDLVDTPGGWMWSHQEVTLRRPDRWHAESTGSHRTWKLDYTLTPRTDGSTELHLRGVRRPTEIGGRNPSTPAMERELRTIWRNFGRALERDWRASPRASRAR